MNIKHAAVFSRQLLRLPDLGHFFPEVKISSPHHKCDGVFGWGYRPTAAKARQYAQLHQIPYIALEDGFLRSIGLGVNHYPPFSLIYDDVGIYYHVAQPNRLENLILATKSAPPELLQQAKQAINEIITAQLSKYNHAPLFSGCLKRENRPSILIVDQTFGDMAVKYGEADETTFTQMLFAAINENPDADIYIKIHPDTLSGKKRGYFAQIPSHVHLISQDYNPISLLKQVDKVYCVTSQMGFEALLCGKQVCVFGAAWYAGWGLTDDRHPIISQLKQNNRRANRNLLQLFVAAYLQYSRYINPNTGQSGNIFDVIEYLKQATRQNNLLRGRIYCAGVSLWKRAVIKPFFRLPACDLRFVSSLNKIPTDSLPENTRLLVWGRGQQAHLNFAAQHNLPILHMEDGFIRSVGLGSNLVPPLSLVIDDLGIYFDANQPSRLEYILQNQIFSQSDLALANHLQHKLITTQTTKYNVGHHLFRQPQTDKPVLLVIGQVEDDASIRLGSPKIYRNIDLLKYVRQHNPQAYIIYKPHPDVVSGNRVGQIAPKDLIQLADQVETESDILNCLNIADQVHTMTSLTGFEALLRGKSVHCYGLPFYAGWGLTHDTLPISRRTRKLSLPELICGTLIYYPAYIHPSKQRPINVTTAIDILAEQKRYTNDTIKRIWLAKQMKKAKYLWRSLKP